MKRSKSGLFLMELIILICFFALAAVICVQLFAAAHTISRRSADIQMAVLHAQNVAEAFKAGEYDWWDAMFDENWNRVGLADDAGRYRIYVDVSKAYQENIDYVDIRVIDRFSEVELHNLTVKRLVNNP